MTWLPWRIHIGSIAAFLSTELAAREHRSVRSASMLLSLAFLAPNLVKAIVGCRLPRGIGLTRMMDLPADWAEQHQALGLRPNLF
jgi:site-specific DNA recombinase